MKITLLFQVAEVVLDVPASQVRVGRAFSALEFILSPQRVHLKSETLQNILFVRLNEKFLNKIFICKFVLTYDIGIFLNFYLEPELESKMSLVRNPDIITKPFSRQKIKYNSSSFLL